MSPEEIDRIARDYIAAGSHLQGSTLWMQSHVTDYIDSPADTLRLRERIAELRAEAGMKKAPG